VLPPRLPEGTQRNYETRKIFDFGPKFESETSRRNAKHSATIRLSPKSVLPVSSIKVAEHEHSGAATVQLKLRNFLQAIYEHYCIAMLHKHCGSCHMSHARTSPTANIFLRIFELNSGSKKTRRNFYTKIIELRVSSITKNTAEVPTFILLPLLILILAGNKDVIQFQSSRGSL
jgi:hypothetical protein